MGNLNRRASYAFLGAGVLALLIGALGIQLWAPAGAHINVLVHTAMETTCGIMVILVALVLLFGESSTAGPGFLTLGLGLLGMGVLDLIHGMAPIGGSFVWLRTGAALAGGIGYGLVGLPPSKRKPKVLWAAAIAVAAAAFGFVELFWDVLPPASAGGRFTPLPIAANLAAAVLFMLGSVHLLRRFHGNPRPVLYMLVWFGVLNGLSGFLFPLRLPWDVSWWFWHGMRVAGAAGAGLYAIYRQFETQNSLDATLAAFQKANAYLENLFNYANAPIVVWDPQFRITRFNHAFESLTGRRAGEVLGKPLEILFTADRVENSMELIKKTATGERWKTVDISILHIGGSIRTVLWNSAMIFATDGKTPLATIAQGQDITERKRAEEALRESEERFKTMFNEAPLGIALIDSLTGHIYEVNPMFAKVAGRTVEQMANIDWMSITHPDDVQEDLDNMALLNAGKIPGFQMKKRYLHLDGAAIWINMTIAPLKIEDKAHPRHLCMIEDITERKQADDRLRGVMADLERSNKELEQFAYVSSHDLQEPLRMVTSYTQLLAERYEGQLDDTARKYIDYAVDGAVRMQRLINDLLAYSRVGTRGKPIETLDAHSVLGEAIRNLTAMIDESKAVVTNEELPMVRADGAQLVQVFQNLLSNAIKFRGEDFPRVHVSVRDEGREWVFAIRDNGIGIDRQYADRVFVIFQRLHTRSEYPGTGIGLAICKRIVERYGGKIWFESEPGKGSTFFFTIPKNVNHESHELHE